MSNSNYLRWNNVPYADANAGQKYALKGAELMDKALDRLNKPLEEYNSIQTQNARNQQAANMAAYKNGILPNNNMNSSGFYNSSAFANPIMFMPNMIYGQDGSITSFHSFL